MWGLLATIWALAGVLLLLGQAIVRLTLIGVAGLSQPLTWYHWVALVGWVLFMAIAEGYRGFQQGFSPRVAARVRYLYEHPTPLRVALAPLFCMGYFDIERRRQIVVLAITALVIGFIVGAHFLDQPWRGIVDIGVVVGLLWGVVALVVFTVRAFGGRLEASPMMPEGSAR